MMKYIFSWVHYIFLAVEAQVFLKQGRFLVKPGGFF